MRSFTAIVVGLGAVAAVWALKPALAHSLKDLETELGSREQYFQPIDKDAPQFALQDAHGRPVGLVDFRGKVAALHFIYTNCPDVCPLHLDRIGEIQAMVNQSPMKDQVQFITITTDPSRDRDNVLTDYGRVHGVDPVNWVFLTTRPNQPEDTTRKIAERYGHKFTKTEDGYQVHGVVTHIIDKEGHWRANFHGLKFDRTNMVAFMNALVNDIERPHEELRPSFWQQLKSWF